MATLIVSFGLGCALGFLATSLLAPQRRSSWYETAANNSESLGRRISEAVMSALPEAGAFLIVAPVKLEGGSGGPARVFAVLP